MRVSCKKNVFALEYVPDKFKTKELCELAVKQNGDALEFVPKKLIDKDIALEAIKNNTNSIRYIPDNINLMDEFDINSETKEVTLKDNNKPKDIQNNILEI